MAIRLYDLCGSNNRRFSPYCWRVRLALAHKGLDHETVPLLFTEIPDVLGDHGGRVPVLDDGGTRVADSFAIAEYLEATYPDRPSLFGGAAGVTMARFVEGFANTVVLAGIAPLIVADVADRVDDTDRTYFVESREKRFGKALAEVQAGRDDAVTGFRKRLDPLRWALRQVPFLGGDGPMMADYILFGSFQWARVASPFALLDADDAVAAWLDRCLSLHGGLGRSESAADA
ncbi:MAG: glutathione S-transferase family protein [Pseudomonadota bacterium]